MNLKKRWLPDIFFIASLFALAFIPWNKLPELVIRGDGFVYLISSTLKDFFNRDFFYTGFELSAATLGLILPKLFKTNMSLYFYTSLLVMMLINVVFYIFLRIITKHKVISFFGALLLAVNYFGNFDMYSQHCYCFFMERIVAVPFLLTSFLFLHIYLEKNKLKLYFVSLALYFFGVGISHFGVLFTAPFLLYPFFWNIFKKKINKKAFIKGIAIGLSFLIISGFFVLIQKISYAQIGPKHGLTEYALSPKENQYPEKILRQLVYWSQYELAIRNIDSSSLRSSLSTKNASEITASVVFVYLLAFFVVYKVFSRYRALLLTVVSGTALIFYLNSWFGQYDVLYQPESNRYLYYPTFLLVIFWTLFLWALWQSKHAFLKVFVLFLIGFYYLLNSLLITQSIQEVLGWDRSTKTTYEYMTNMGDRLLEGTLVVAPYPEVGVYESIFFTEQLRNGEAIFLGEENPYRDWKKIASSSAHVIKLKYNKKCDCIKEKKIK